MSGKEADAIARALVGQKIVDLNRQHTDIVGALGQTVGKYTGIGWTGTAHTSDMVLTLATGPGREHFAGIMHHVDVFRVLTRLMGIDFTNPSMTRDEARKHAAGDAVADLVHWV